MMRQRFSCGALEEVAAIRRSNAPPYMTTSPEGPDRPMLQALLKDRFHLPVHSENREMPVYVNRPVIAPPDFFTAVRKQLGLNMEQLPTEN
jgi:hypothetical protein